MRDASDRCEAREAEWGHLCHHEAAQRARDYWPNVPHPKLDSCEQSELTRHTSEGNRGAQGQTITGSELQGRGRGRRPAHTAGANELPTGFPASEASRAKN